MEDDVEARLAKAAESLSTQDAEAKARKEAKAQAEATVLERRRELIAAFDSKLAEWDAAVNRANALLQSSGRRLVAQLDRHKADDRQQPIATLTAHLEKSPRPGFLVLTVSSSGTIFATFEGAQGEKPFIRPFEVEQAAQADFLAALTVYVELMAG